MSVEVVSLDTEYVKLYSKGVEEKYNGFSVEYYDNTLTFLYFYYPFLTRLYVVNGMRKVDKIVQIKNPVNKICCFDNRSAIRLRMFLEEKIKFEDKIFYFPPMFIREVSAIIEKRKYKIFLSGLYEKYKERLANGIINTYI